MNNDISVILNVYKRPDTLEKQIEAILNQSVKINPENIHIWYNYSGKGQYLPKNKKIKTYVCNWNTKFFGRFTIPLLCKTKYIAMFDDDILPQKDWFKNCLDSMGKKEGLYGGSGVILNAKQYNGCSKVGWNGLHSNKIEECDLQGHSWFFKQEWIKYLWDEEIISWDNGEDIMFAYACSKRGIKSYVPPHPENLWTTDDKFARTIGSDENASWLKRPHIGERDKIVIKLINNGWETINNIK
jgi:glycosyltransferase involved in cell wall biosynthesis